MRRALVVIVGMIVLMAGAVRSSESVVMVVVNTCLLNGTYNFSGLAEAAGFEGIIGFLVFSPDAPCTGGTVSGSVTIGRQNQVATTVPLSGTYSVAGDGPWVVSVSVPGIIQLTGLGSLLAGGIFNSIHFVVTLDPPQPQALSVTATRTPPIGLATVFDRSSSTFALTNTAAPTNVYVVTVPANTLVGGRLLRGRLLYDYSNNTGSGKNLTIQLIFGSTTIGTQTLVNLSTGFALGELEFVLGDTLGSNFQNGGFRGVHGDPGMSGPIPLIAVGTSGENLATPLALQIKVTHSAASANLSFRKLSVVLELL
jgi:hypothetical protein